MAIEKIPKVLIYQDQSLAHLIATKINELIDVVNHLEGVKSYLCDHDPSFRCPKCEVKDEPKST